MDINTMLSSMFAGLVESAFQFWYLFLIVVLGFIFKSAWLKNKVDEFLITFQLNRSLNKQQYHLLKNITLPTKGGTTQIDHIVVSQFGIFVVKTKNMKGWILGTAKQRKWTQQISEYSGKFQNPVRQNNKQTKMLANGLNVPKDFINSVIVFFGDCTFKMSMPENVTYAQGFANYIKAKNEVVFTQEQVTDIVMTIESGRFDS